MARTTSLRTESQSCSGRQRYIATDEAKIRCEGRRGFRARYFAEANPWKTESYRTGRPTGMHSLDRRSKKTHSPQISIEVESTSQTPRGSPGVAIADRMKPATKAFRSRTAPTYLCDGTHQVRPMLHPRNSDSSPRRESRMPGQRASPGSLRSRWRRFANVAPRA
jgi:hypothetical protein